MLIRSLSKTTRIAAIGVGVLGGVVATSATTAALSVAPPEPATAVTITRYDGSELLETISVTPADDGTATAQRRDASGELTSATIDDHGWDYVSEIPSELVPASSIYCDDQAVVTYSLPDGGAVETAGCVMDVPCGPTQRAADVYELVQSAFDDDVQSALRQASPAGLVACDISEEPQPDPMPNGTGEPWPVEALVITYRFQPEPGDTSSPSIVLVAGRVGDGIPSVTVDAVWPGGTTDALVVAIDDDNWNEAVRQLFAAGIDGSSDDCRDTTQQLSVSFGGDEVLAACIDGDAPPDAWLAFLEPLVADLPDLEQPDVEVPSVGSVESIEFSASNLSLPPEHAWSSAVTITAGDDGSALVVVETTRGGTSYISATRLDADEWAALGAEVAELAPSTDTSCAPGSAISTVVVTFDDGETVEVGGCGVETGIATLDDVLAGFEIAG